MFEFTSEFKENVQAIGNLIKGFQFISQYQVVVGIPKEGGGDTRNVDLLYLHENGSPARNIPPRPVLKIGLSGKDTQQKINQLLRQGAVIALMGNVEKAMTYYEKAGLVGVAAVKGTFGSGALAPNAPSTIARKGSSAPLIDTGALQASITYAVRKKGG